MDDESRAELMDQAEAFRAVDEMVKTTGWQKFIIPRIEQYKEKHETNLRNSKELNEIMRSQEGLNAIDELLSTLMMDIHIGEEAIETLSKEKQE